MRELRNIVERASLLSDGDRIELKHLPPEVVAPDKPGGAPAAAPGGAPAGSTLQNAERDALAHALSRHTGSRRDLALALVLSERTLYRKLRSFGLAKPRGSAGGG